MQHFKILSIFLFKNLWKLFDSLESKYTVHYDDVKCTWEDSERYDSCYLKTFQAINIKSDYDMDWLLIA
jgi:hypothetical protein